MLAEPVSKTLATAVLACLALALPAFAAEPHSVVIANTGRVNAPSCPANPCTVISRTTAVQAKDGSVRDPFEIRASGRIVSWSVTLAVPSSGQVHYFDSHEGGTSRAELAVLRNASGLTYKLVALSPLVHLEPYFGKTAELALAHPLSVAKGDILALSVPTWAPALALGYPATTSWRASRGASGCTDVTSQTSQTTLGASTTYDCLYQTALVTFSATETVGG